MSLQCLVVVVEDSARLAAGGEPLYMYKDRVQIQSVERVKGSAVPAGRVGWGKDCTFCPKGKMHEQTIGNRNSKIRKIKDLQMAHVEKEEEGEASPSFIHSFRILWRG